MNYLTVWILLHAVLRQTLLEVLLNLERQSVLEQTRNFLSIVSMAITDGEEVTVTQIEHVWIGQVCILIDLVRIVSRYASLRCERELRHDVVHRVRISLATTCLFCRRSRCLGSWCLCIIELCDGCRLCLIALSLF